MSTAKHPPTAPPNQQTEVTIVRTAEFKTQGYEAIAMLGRKDAGHYSLQIVNVETQQPEYSKELKGSGAPDLFLSEVVTFLANRLQIQLLPSPQAEPPAPPPGIEIVKEMPK